MEPAGTTRISFVERLSDRTNTLCWTEFHERYGELLFRYARRRGASREEAEDIVQDVEMYLFRAMEEFHYDPSRGGFRAYLRRAVAHATARRLEKQTRGASGVDPHTLAALVDNGEDEDAQWEHEWRLHRLRRAFLLLSGEFEPVTLEAFRLHVLANHTVDEAADHLGISKASVYQAKSRVLKKLKERIEAMDPDSDP